MALSSPFQNKGERRTFFRILAFTVAIFLSVATTEIMIFNGHPAPHHYILPIIVAVLVGGMLAWNALLRRRLELSNRAKSDFISLISHEIRTPLTVINGFSRVLAESADLKDREKDFARRIHFSGEHLLTIINDMLDMSAIESGMVNIELQKLELTRLLSDSCDMIRAQAKDSGIVLRTEFTPVDRYVIADQTRLKQVILNLLSNAIKYNHQGGNVWVSVEDSSPEFYRILVEDSGAGIPEDKREAIFAQFERLERDRDSSRGTGLGLPISRSLMRMMGGEIGFSSRPEQGSIFWIEIRKPAS